MRFILIFLVACTTRNNDPQACQEACDELGMASWTAEPTADLPSCVCNPKCP